jgi:hypothetical protein
MKVIRKIIYLIVALSLLPVTITYFAYGNKLDMLYMGITLGALFTLIYMVSKPSKSLAKWTFVLSFSVFLIQIVNLKFYWFEDKGGDPMVRIVFTIQWLVMAFALVFLFKESQFLKRKV